MRLRRLRSRAYDSPATGDNLQAGLGQSRATASLPSSLAVEHGLAEQLVQLFDEHPGMLVGHVHLSRGGRNRAEGGYFLQQLDLTRTDSPVRVEVDSQTQRRHGTPSFVADNALHTTGRHQSKRYLCAWPLSASEPEVSSMNQAARRNLRPDTPLAPICGMKGPSPSNATTNLHWPFARLCANLCVGSRKGEASHDVA